MVRGLYPRPLPVEELVADADLGRCWAGGPTGCRAGRRSGSGSPPRSRATRELLVLDEPTAAMDVQARRDFWQQIRGFAAGGAPCCSRPTTCKRPTTTPTGSS